MDLTAIIAAAPVVRRAWKFTPVPLRLPLIVAGVAFVAWRWFADKQDESSADGSETDAA